MLRMLAAHGTVTATAQALHYTPSAVSHQLRTLAEDLGVVLLTPQGRGVRLTPAARILLTHIDSLFSSWEHIRGLLEAESGGYAGTLRLCGFSTAAAALLPAVALEETAEQQWIVDRPGRPHRQLVFSSCAEAGFTPMVAHEAAEWDTGAALVAAGFGVCLIPRLARVPSGYSITRVPLRGDPAPSRHIRTVVRRGSGSQPVLAEALEMLREVADAAHRRPVPGAD